MKIHMIDYQSFFGSREGGVKFRENILRKLGYNDENLPLELDFTGVSIITSGFADEVFGKFALEIGQLTFMRQFQFSGMNDDIMIVIERALSQRMALGADKL